MRIENITSETLESMDDSELRYLRSRCLNIFDRYFARSDVQKAVGMDRRWFLTKYLLLRSEMENRGIKLFRERPLDKEVHNRIFKASLWKLDVPALGDMVAIPNYVSVCGEFIKSPVASEKIDVVIRTAKEHRNEVFEAKISELVKEQTNKEPNFIYEPKGPDKSYIPLFDLVLKSHEETRKMKMAKEMGGTFDINKPFANEHSCRLKNPGEFKPESFRRIERTTDRKRYSIVMGRLKGEVTMTEQAYRYPKDTWTEAQAKSHCKDHDGILFEPASEKKKKFQIEKPEETENTIRIPIGSECEVTATITIDKGQGISALYCGRDKRIRTYQFDKRVKAWTMVTARSWIKAQTEKINKALEENLETFEYLIHHVAMEGDEEIVHHCNMYDHIGNVFEQAHLWIDGGKIYLDGKEIKEGHYHVIKGLEQTQEIAWSEKEATDAGIKPKRMMSGMTLKEKAKVW